MDKGLLCHPLQLPDLSSSHWLCCYAPIAQPEGEQLYQKLFCKMQVLPRQSLVVLQLLTQMVDKTVLLFSEEHSPYMTGL